MVETKMWDAIKQQLHGKMPSQAFENWVARTQLLSVEDPDCALPCLTEVTKMWMESEYAATVGSAPMLELKLPVGGALRTFAGHTCPACPAIQWQHCRGCPGSGLHAGQQTAQSSSDLRLLRGWILQSVCPRGRCGRGLFSFPVIIPNSFIYGGSGMGKTHLVHAIGMSLLNNLQSMRIVYTTGERFVNEIMRIRTDRMGTFHQHYRTTRC